MDIQAGQGEIGEVRFGATRGFVNPRLATLPYYTCLLYTSDAADDLLCVDLGGRRIIKKKQQTYYDDRQPERDCCE